MGKITLGFGFAMVIGFAIGIAVGMAFGIYFIAHLVEDVIETDGLYIEIQLNETNMMDYAIKLVETQAKNGN